MIVSGEHMFGTEIDKREQVNARDFLYVTLIALGHAVSECGRGEQKKGQQSGEHASVCVKVFFQLKFIHHLSRSNSKFDLGQSCFPVSPVS